MKKNDVRVSDNPKLMKKELSDGNYALFLDYYLGRVTVVDEITGRETSKVRRKREFLKLTLLSHPRTPAERTENKNTLELAAKIRAQKEKDFKSDKFGYVFINDHANLWDFMNSYLAKYDKKDIKVIKSAINKFKAFIVDNYPNLKDDIKSEQLSKGIMEEFRDHLLDTCMGSGSISAWRRFKKVMKAATEAKILRANPCDDVKMSVDDDEITKDILSEDEMEKMITTKVDGQNKEIRRAFIFTLYTGVRFCDVKELKYSDVDYSNKLLTFNQSKTSGHSKNSWVHIPLRDDLLELIGNSEDDADGLIFNLPTHAACVKSLKRWALLAGVHKHVTWHVGRHSFATNILADGADIKTVSSLLGHSSVRMTEKYTHAVDKLKKEAVNSLPKIKF